MAVYIKYSPGKISLTNSHYHEKNITTRLKREHLWLLFFSDTSNKYLSSVAANLSPNNEEYRAMQAPIISLYEKYPKVLGVFDSEQAAELTEEKAALA